MTGDGSVDLVEHDVRASRRNDVWISSPTYVATWSGFVCVAFVIGVFVRRIVGCRVSGSLVGDLTVNAVEQATCERHGDAEGPRVHRIERGVLHLSSSQTERLAESGIETSVRTRGDTRADALAEAVIGLFTTEVVRIQGPRRSLEEAEFATLEWV